MLIQDSRDTFCILPFTHMQIGNTGLLRICDQAPWLTDFEGKQFDIYKDSVATIWNSQAMRQVRCDLINGKTIAQCETCWQIEKHGGQSRRLQENFRWQKNVDIESEPPASGLLKKINHYLKWKFRHKSIENIMTVARRENYVVKIPPIDFEIEVGNVCNLKCRTCSPLFSSLIADDPVHSKWCNDSNTTLLQHQSSLRNDNASTSLRLDEDHWLRRNSLVYGELFRNPKTVRKVCFKGGEPMISKEVIDIINHLAAKGDNGKLLITTVTNGTVYNPELMKALSKIKTCNIAVSIDGIGPCCEYIRYPSKWETILKNMQRFASFENIFLMTSVTLQMYNLMDIVKVFKFCDQHNYIINSYMLKYPIYLSQTAMPPKARKVAAQRMLEYVEDGCKKENINIIRSYAKSLISLGENHDIEALRDFMQFTWDLDKSRKQDFRVTNPELWGYIQELGVSWPAEN